MIKLKDLIKEDLLTEATRWSVGVEMPNGKVTSVYGHYDGYPDYVGKILKKYYNQGGKVRDLIKLGATGISTLDKSMKGGKDHSFDSPKDGETVFYGRDRGEKGNYTQISKDRNSIKTNSGEEFVYVWSMKERKWYYRNDNWPSDRWEEL